MNYLLFIKTFNDRQICNTMPNHNRSTHVFIYYCYCYVVTCLLLFCNVCRLQSKFKPFLPAVNFAFLGQELYRLWSKSLFNLQPIPVRDKESRVIDCNFGLSLCLYPGSNITIWHIDIVRKIFRLGYRSRMGCGVVTWEYHIITWPISHKLTTHCFAKCWADLGVQHLPVCSCSVELKLHYQELRFVSWTGKCESRVQSLLRSFTKLSWGGLIGLRTRCISPFHKGVYHPFCWRGTQHLLYPSAPST